MAKPQLVWVKVKRGIRWNGEHVGPDQPPFQMHHMKAVELQSSGRLTILTDEQVRGMNKSVAREPAMQEPAAKTGSGR
jgi:hypothetical protein